MSLADDIRTLFAENSGDYEPTAQEIAAINDGLNSLLSSESIAARPELARQLPDGWAAMVKLIIGARYPYKGSDATERARHENLMEIAMTVEPQRAIQEIIELLSAQCRAASDLYHLTDDEIRDAAKPYALGNPRMDSLRTFVNHVIIVAGAKYRAAHALDAARPVQTGDRLTEDQLREMYARAKAMTEGAWIDMMGRALLAASTASDKQEALTKTQANDLITAYARELVSKNHSAVYAAYEALMNALIAAPLAQSAEQDRIDAEFIGAEWRAIFNEVCTGASFEKFCEWMREEIGASK
jgi:hypothetical protein